jgi:type II secretory pathway pseudopilin PulG
MRQTNEKAFSLLEVMITMGILMGLVVGVASMLRSSIDLKQALARESRITHRLSLAANKISHDIEHAFITGLNEEHRGGANRRFKTIFKVDKGSDTDKIYMTSTEQQSIKKDSKQGDTAYIVYEVRDAKDAAGRKHLFRGASQMTLEDLKTDPPMKLFVRNIKSLKVIPWRGDDWSLDKWDSSRGEWRDKLPQMVRLEIETWSEDDNEVSGDTPADGKLETGTVAIKTVIRLQNSRFMKEIKQPNTSMRLY